ncbi:MAG TPA: TetR/AcrR family transcriptional regulator [Ktedonobacteraceae bacterium]|nr:TetR/AcrR family transcriptional regulator [Ktedonobacteraceae bacterium]
MNSNSQEQEHEGQPRVSRRRARTRTDLLRAARQVFAARGYHDASIAEITELADVGVGTFYLHFRDKDEAFTTLLEEGFAQLREQVKTAVQEAKQRREGAPLLPVIVRAIFRHAYEQRDLFQIALTGGGLFVHVRAFRVQTVLTEALTHTLEGYQAQGLLADYDIPLLARFITGIITQGIVWWFEHDKPGPEAIAEQSLLLLRSGLPSPLFENT